MILKILDGHADNPGDLSWDSFNQFADVTVYDRTTLENIVTRSIDADAIFINKVSVTEQVLEQLPKLRYIGVCATGYNVVDITACKKRGIIVTNIPSYSTDSVAQHVFALITYFTNHVALHNQSVQNGDWITAKDFVYWKEPLTELAGKTMGIFGYGNIGSKVAQIAKAFGMNVICNSRTKKPDMPEFVSFEELLSRSDFLSLHAPLTEQTQNIINKKTLSLMKKSAILINTARGGFVVEKDMAEALNNKMIAGFAADVVAHEPMNKDCPLLGCPNCVLTPHIAWAPKETRARLIDIAFENFKAWLEGKPINVVS
ncbi:MAG: D-2-hydroxyacid dehydrogenase [Spirochaetales bacterium]|nr:D-2-hydroxyacid dehydrogenase [Spirochaetales bacterium]